MNLDFHGKVALVTGASSGIGEATAGELSKMGCNLMLTGRNEKQLTALKDGLKNQPGKIEFLSGDLSDTPFRKKLVEKTIENFGRLDILVNSAGIIEMKTIETTSIFLFTTAPAPAPFTSYLLPLTSYLLLLTSYLSPLTSYLLPLTSTETLARIFLHFGHFINPLLNCTHLSNFFINHSQPSTNN